jgi:hypothetical protein
MTKGDTPERKAQWRESRDRQREEYRKDRATRKFQREMETGRLVAMANAVAEREQQERDAREQAAS